jgi:hypothetical protein
MKKSPKDKIKTLSRSSTNTFFTITNEKASDFWWNFAYFLILSTAITFILANNPSNTLRTTPALIILGLLLSLDVFPTFYLVKTLIRYSMNRNRK